MTIGLSISDITSTLYAQSALATYLGGPSAPQALQRDQSDLLGRIVADAFAHTASALHNYLTSVDIDVEILTAEVADPAPASLNLMFKAAVEAEASSMVWHGIDPQESRRYRDVWRDCIDQIADALSRPQGPLRITPDRP